MHKIVNGVKVDMSKEESEQIEREWKKSDEEASQALNEKKKRNELIHSSLEKICSSLSEEEKHAFKNFLGKLLEV